MAATKRGAKAGAKEAPAEAPEAEAPEEGQASFVREDLVAAKEAARIARNDTKLAYEEAARGL